MLNKSTVEIAANLSEVLVDRQIKLVPKINTLIGEMSSVVKNACFNPTFIDRDAVVRTIETISVGHNSGAEGGPKTYINSEHDTLMDNYIGDMSVLVGNYLNFSRTVVNARVSEFKERLELGINNYRYRDPEDFFEVSYYRLPDIFRSSLVRDEVRSFGKGGRFKKEYINLKELEGVEDLTQYFMTGHEESDNDISGWLPSVSWVRGALFDDTNEIALSLPEALEYALVNYIFYRNLQQRTDINTGDTTVALRRKAKENTLYFSDLLSRNINMFETLLKTGKLLGVGTNTNFSYLTQGPFKVVIYEENFAKAADEGCTVETLFGFLASQDSSLNLTVKDLIANKDKYSTVWARTRGLYLVHLNSNRLDVFKHLVRVQVDESLHKDRITESEEEMMSKDGAFVSNTLKLSHAYVDELTVGDVDCIDKVCLDLVAKIRFRFTDSYAILKNMEELLTSDENLDPKEAGLYSAINYLVDYCLQQVEVIKL